MPSTLPTVNAKATPTTTSESKTTSASGVKSLPFSDTLENLNAFMITPPLKMLFLL